MKPKSLEDAFLSISQKNRSIWKMRIAIEAGDHLNARRLQVSLRTKDKEEAIRRRNKIIRDLFERKKLRVDHQNRDAIKAIFAGPCSTNDGEQSVGHHD